LPWRADLQSATRICFSINLPAERYLHYYRGNARAVIVRSEDGRRIQLPAANLRPFVTAEGIVGRFELTLDEHNKLIDIRRADY
jgi:hypothetical protein